MTDDPLTAIDTRRVLAEVAIERRRQDEIHGGPPHDDTHTAAEWQSMIFARLDERAEWARSQEHRADWRRAIVEVAAIATAAVEALDRGAMRR